MRVWLGIALAGMGLLLAILAADVRPVQAFAGALLVTGILMAAVPWRRLRGRRRADEGLWTKPGPGQRWCAGCGRPAGPTCVHCGDKARRLQQEEKRKQRAQRKALREKQSASK